MTTILIVDDDEGCLEGYEMLFKSVGYNVIKAFDGQKGLEAAVLNKPDLIVTDKDMPRMNGYQMYLALKDNAFTKEIPVIGTGSFSQYERKELPYYHEKGKSGLGDLVKCILDDIHI